MSAQSSARRRERRRLRLLVAQIAGHDRRERRPRADAELVVDPREVALDGLLAEEQRRGHVAVSLTRRHQRRHLPLACAQCASWSVGGVGSRTGRNATDAPRPPAAQAAKLLGGGIGLARGTAFEQRPLGAFELRDPALELAASGERGSRAALGRGLPAAHCRSTVSMRRPRPRSRSRPRARRARAARRRDRTGLPRSAGAASSPWRALQRGRGRGVRRIELAEGDLRADQKHPAVPAAKVEQPLIGARFEGGELDPGARRVARRMQRRCEVQPREAREVCLAHALGASHRLLALASARAVSPARGAHHRVRPQRPDRDLIVSGQHRGVRRRLGDLGRVGDPAPA